MDRVTDLVGGRNRIRLTHNNLCWSCVHVTIIELHFKRTLSDFVKNHSNASAAILAVYDAGNHTGGARKCSVGDTNVVTNTEKLSNLTLVEINSVECLELVSLGSFHGRSHLHHVIPDIEHNTTQIDVLSLDDDYSITRYKMLLHLTRQGSSSDIILKLMLASSVRLVQLHTKFNKLLERRLDRCARQKIISVQGQQQIPVLECILFPLHLTGTQSCSFTNHGANCTGFFLGHVVEQGWLRPHACPLATNIRQPAVSSFWILTEISQAWTKSHNIVVRHSLFLSHNLS
mmetsp:Transcript_5166/g.12189  ORF Transcript_5166/g.12189 Transcript_5166/m.12189 type:complete len:288 (-) Transcript_5166:758-1621(-)